MSIKTESINVSRRNFFQGKKMLSTPTIRLPWAIDDAAFLQGCTQCGDCLDACPENIIVKDDNGFPKVNFQQGECTFCGDCVSRCEQPLFTSRQQPAWQVHLNLKDNCLAKNNIYCQSCQDSCEQQALTFKYLSAIPSPVIEQSACNGCGACISVCPSQSLELIKVEN